MISEHKILGSCDFVGAGASTLAWGPIAIVKLRIATDMLFSERVWHVLHSESVYEHSCYSATGAIPHALPSSYVDSHRRHCLRRVQKPYPSKIQPSGFCAVASTLPNYILGLALRGESLCSHPESSYAWGQRFLWFGLGRGLASMLSPQETEEREVLRKLVLLVE